MDKSKIREIVDKKHVEACTSLKEEDFNHMCNGISNSDSTISNELIHILAMNIAIQISKDILIGVLDELLPQIVESSGK